ncbi:glyoxylase-like metal-dependent hydrolase (beta-lactamase superfamily II) [Micromonospora pisi]|uniref:Glyoxylase-like metal-dependent hydrolase (Beta-lactamase superfamily II) n=1 Tax=Micromonospora pisi TaxID=589240 RepID=A0A495JBL6_9ACTN|nr:MBL fold metallo-hydrolase [Micromonospora pisi]RKR86400.1 glyoxylase-like metal-dependent hydrolase (beta-lactamase superfamily II) [Micromonospora pisi]
MNTSDLSYEVFISEGPTRAGDQRMPNGDRISWSPLSSTLIYGAQDALLVDPPFTHDQIRKVGDWIERSGKRLAYVYVTHGHGDHWFGTGELLKRFPGATVYATEGTIEVMHQQATVGREQLFDRVFPGLIPESPVLAVPIPEAGFHLEGNIVRAVETGHTDTDHSSVLHVPAIGLVVAGDVVYNGVHQYFLEGANGGLEEWIKALDRISELGPRAVVAGHKNRDLPDDPAAIEQTREYLRDLIRLLDEKPTAREFYDRMTALHPDRLNPGPVWYGALGLLGA